MQDDDPAPELPPASDVLLPTQPSLTPSTQGLSDEALGGWFRSHWAKGPELLKSFENSSWGSAYKAIADVQVLLMIGKMFKMEINLATHSVSPGTYIDDGQQRTIQFATLGHYINGQAEGTWMNRLTFFFAVYHFIRETESTTKETLGDELWEARGAMLTWGVSLRMPTSFLDVGDDRTMYSKATLHRMIKQYMVSR